MSITKGSARAGHDAIDEQISMKVLFATPVRAILGIAAMVFCTAIAVAMARAPAPGDVRVGFEQIEGELVRVHYALARRTRALNFGDRPHGYRAENWRFETTGMQIVMIDDEEWAVRRDGKKFDSFSVIVTPAADRLPKEYQPVSAYGDGGAMIFTGHFWPMREAGGRRNTSFSFTPAPGGSVVAFGERAAALADWRSPMAHPAFVYMGTVDPVETPEVMALVDPAAPGWVIEEFYSLTPQVFSHFAKIFGFTLETKPNLFLAAPVNGDKSRLSYAGDALPGQFQITLDGGGWAAKTRQTETIFRRSTIHEAVHLWQSVVRPSVEDVAAWVHEGAADAIANETMTALGLWDEAQGAQNFRAAKNSCAEALDEGSLASAGERNAWRAYYACGHIIAAAVARADGASVSDFWAAFIERAGAANGYSEALYFDFVEERTGNPVFVTALRHFVRTPLADPGREINRLLAAATPPLAPEAGR